MNMMNSVDSPRVFLLLNMKIKRWFLLLGFQDNSRKYSNNRMKFKYGWKLSLVSLNDVIRIFATQMSSANKHTCNA